MIPRKNVYLIELNGNSDTVRWYPESGNFPESILPAALNGSALIGPRGRLTGVRMRLDDEAGAVTSVRLQIFQEVNGAETDDHLIYDSGVLTDGVDGIVLAESADTAFWLDPLPADVGTFGAGAVHGTDGLQQANSRDNYLRLKLTQVGAGLNRYAVAFDTLEEE